MAAVRLANILAGEDPAAYDELLARIRAAVKPLDIIEEMFIADVVSLEWEVLRWRRLKLSLIQARGLKALENFLVEQLESNYDLHEEHFAELSRKNSSETTCRRTRRITAETLAAECAQNDRTMPTPSSTRSFAASA